ncbi:MAG: hypothetical protein OIF51_21840 [Cellvibrionaceae bacterium]|nr:hypothetical protein [Cellvibrionaceae bacterium]
MKKKLITLAILSSLPWQAATADQNDILQRLEQLERKSAQDQKTISELTSKLNALSQQSSGSDSVKLEQRLVKLEKKTQRQTKSLKRKIESQKDRLSIKGFASVYATKANVKGVTLEAGVDTHWDFSPDTIAGLQFDYKVSDSIDAVIQLTAKGKNDFDMEAEWAFLRFNVNDSLALRGGRMRLPWYMYSESIEVGYAYPWVRPPAEVYVTSFTTYEGVDATYSHPIGSWNTDTKIYYGTAGTDVAEAEAVSGIAFTAEKESLTLRASYNQIDTISITGFPLSDDIDYYSASARYDNGKWFAMLEGAEADIGKKLPFLGNIAMSGTLGYQFEKWMPYMSLSKTYSDASHESNAVSPVQKVSMESITLGMRYNLNNQVSLKAEIADYDNFDGTLGNTVIGTELALNPNLVNELDKDGVHVLSVGFDAVF